MTPDAPLGDTASVGASGSAWIKPKKQRGLRATAITEVPHPTSARAGQRFFPLDGRARNAVPIRVVRARAAAGHCEARREDASSRIVRVDTARLLAADETGAGVHYRFVGYAPRASYRTHACVVAVAGGWARLICPEWHPAMPIAVAAGGLPQALRAVGSWVACKGDLGATTPAAAGLHAFAPPAASFDPATLHPVSPVDDATQPELRSDAEDVVLFVSEQDAAATMEGDRGVYLTGHPPPTGHGRRAYLCVDGVVVGWRAVAATRPLPSGSRVLLEGPWNPVTVSVTPTLPAASVTGGRFGRQLWAPRSWAIADESPAQLGGARRLSVDFIGESATAMTDGPISFA